MADGGPRPSGGSGAADARVADGFAEAEASAADGAMPKDAESDARGTIVDVSVPDANEPEDAAPPGIPALLELSGDLNVHDPVIIEAGGRYTIFSTGPGVRIKRSDDLLAWEIAGSVFESNPPWIAAAVPGASDLWAPDIAFAGGVYHLYYSASTFGSRNSCIGHATTNSLTTAFVDDGSPVICSDDSDDWNAIDPNYILDESGQAWLSFGSFWSGIKMIRLNDSGRRQGTDFHSLASRGGAAIEAPFIVHHGGFYYLFVSFDYCCHGVSSTYRIMVGRSENVVGPYVDREGNAMLDGGGTPLVVGNQRWRGPGHNSVLVAGNDSYLVYHSYDAENGGAATLRILELLWDNEGWPIPGGP